MFTFFLANAFAQLQCSDWSIKVLGYLKHLLLTLHLFDLSGVNNVQMFGFDESVGI